MPDSLPSAAPWYRQRWPWLLISGPAIVVVAGLATAWIAVRSDDGLVAEDYYKRGLLINKELERSGRGEALGLGAVVRTESGGRVSVELTAATGSAPVPSEVRLKLARPTKAGNDVTLPLTRGTDGSYRGRVDQDTGGRWVVTVETDSWQLSTVAAAKSLEEVRLGTARAVR